MLARTKHWGGTGFLAPGFGARQRKGVPTLPEEEGRGVGGGGRAHPNDPQGYTAGIPIRKGLRGGISAAHFVEPGMGYGLRARVEVLADWEVRFYRIAQGRRGVTPLSNRVHPSTSTTFFWALRRYVVVGWIRRWLALIGRPE